MINERIVELLREPEKIQPADLQSISAAISKYPFAQSLRALQLYGVHKLDDGKYTALLSETAAYTSNKKNLYQLINGISLSKSTAFDEIEKNERIDVIHSETMHQSKPEVLSYNFDIEKHPEVQNIERPAPVVVNGRINRILFKGEENFMNEASPSIDFEISKESGTLVLQNHMNTPQPEPVLSVSNDDKAFAVPETATADQNLSEHSDSGTAPADEAQLSFHRTEEFLPKVAFPAAPEKISAAVTPKNDKISRHEQEMQRLLAEVEAKMQESRASKTKRIPQQEQPSGAEVNFAETADFDFKKAPVEDMSAAAQERNNADVFSSKETVEADHEWKPMSFSSGTADQAAEQQAQQSETILQSHETEERQVVNMSFFSQDVKPITEEKKPDISAQSNIPQFVNTWQNWLKLGRQKEPVVPETIAVSNVHEPAPKEAKSAVIEKFIENEPKISRYKEESSYIVRERGEDISHLMTETLANLYVEQRLYAKAIKAYTLLISKYSDRKERYEKRIEEIKFLRQK